jgi:hypothetical protein
MLRNSYHHRAHSFTGLTVAILLTVVSPSWAADTCGPTSQPHWVDAVDSGNRRLVEWLLERSKPLASWDHAMYGPTLDKTYFYRLGESDTWDVDSLGKKLEETKAQLIAQGFPQPSAEELESVLLANNFARARAAPNVIRCAKHFPGGDERIELTEEQGYFFSSVEETRGFLQPFVDALSSSTPPTCIMVGHAKYPHETFQANARQSLGPMMPDIPFESLNASVNPGVISYLRHALGFNGVIVADYALMNAFDVYKFWPNWNGGYTNVRLGLVAIYAATYAGVDLIQSTFLPTPKKAADVQAVELELSHLDPSVRQDWNDRLSAWLTSFSSRIGAPLSSGEIAALSMATKVYLKSPPFSTDDISSFDLETQSLPLAFKKKLASYAFGKDTWNRSGVMTMLQRQFIIEKLWGKHFANPPSGQADEKRWFMELNTNTEFQGHYHAIDWSGPDMLNSFCQTRQRFNK